MANYTQSDIVSAASEKGIKLKKSGSEYKGPCALCNGTDRFYVKPDGKFFCRQCMPNGSDKNQYKNFLTAFGLYQEPNPHKAHRHNSSVVSDHGLSPPDSFVITDYKKSIT